MYAVILVLRRKFWVQVFTLQGDTNTHQLQAVPRPCSDLRKTEKYLSLHVTVQIWYSGDISCGTLIWTMVRYAHESRFPEPATQRAWLPTSCLLTWCSLPPLRNQLFWQQDRGVLVWESTHHWEGICLWLEGVVVCSQKHPSHEKWGFKDH